MDKELRKEAINNYKSRVSTSWILGVALAIFAAAIVMSGLVSEFLLYPLVILLLFPFFFSCIVTHLVAKEDNEITFTKQFSRSLLFFRSGNYRSFRMISSFLYSFLVYAVFSTFGTLIALIVFRNNYPEAFTEIYQAFVDAIYNGEEESFLEILTSYEELIALYELLVVTPSSLAAVTFFLYRTTLHAIFVYAKNFLHRFQVVLIVAIHNLVFKTMGNKIRKDYFSLNWPIFVIFPIFSVGMGIITYLYIRQTATAIISFGIAVGFLSLMFYLPFYFGNMEALFNKYANEYKKCTIEIIDGLKQRSIDSSLAIEDEEDDIASAIKDLDDDDESSEE